MNGFVLGAIVAGPIGAAIGGLVGSGGKLSETKTEKRVAVIVLLKDGRHLVCSCDLKELGLLSAAVTNNKVDEMKRLNEDRDDGSIIVAQLADTNETPKPIPDLPTHVLRILNKHHSGTGFYIWPDIPAKKLANAKSAADVTQNEKVLGLVDCTPFGSATDCILFGEKSLYYHHSAGSQPNPGKIPYARFPGIEFSASWLFCISLGGDKYCTTNGANVRRDVIIAILKAIGKATIG